jgi:hypothetical protein
LHWPPYVSGIGAVCPHPVKNDGKTAGQGNDRRSPHETTRPQKTPRGVARDLRWIGFRNTPKVKTLTGPAPTTRPQTAEHTHQRLANRQAIVRSLDPPGSTRPMVMTLSLPGVEVPGPAHADCSAWPLAAKPLFSPPTSRDPRASANGRPCWDSPTSSIPATGPDAGNRLAAPAPLTLLVDFAEAILQPLAFLAVGRVGEPVADLVLGAFESLAMLA